MYTSDDLGNLNRNQLNKLYDALVKGEQGFFLLEHKDCKDKLKKEAQQLKIAERELKAQEKEQERLKKWTRACENCGEVYTNVHPKTVKFICDDCFKRGYNYIQANKSREYRYVVDKHLSTSINLNQLIYEKWFAKAKVNGEYKLLNREENLIEYERDLYSKFSQIMKISDIITSKITNDTFEKWNEEDIIKFISCFQNMISGFRRIFI